MKTDNVPLIVKRITVSIFFGLIKYLMQRYFKNNDFKNTYIYCNVI